MPTAPTIHSTSTGAKKHSTADQDGKRRQESRQFKTNSSYWRKLRAAQLRLEPLCRECGSVGITKAANVVDHIDGNSWNNEQNNFASLCYSCHNSKTARQDGGFGRDKK
jgi:5-methylcytosine-specific restriction protein A